MNDGRWIDADDPADEAFVEHAVQALREDIPDAAHMRLLEQRLPRALEGEASRSAWWRRPHLHVILGGTIAVASAVLASRHSPSPVAPVSVVPAHTAPRSVAPPPDEAPPSTPTSMPAISVDALPESPRGRPSRVAIAPKPSVAWAPEAPALGDELAILEAATRALDADPARALVLTEEHATRFQTPRFAEERERLAIHALVRLGRRADAASRAAAFEAAYPRSAHLKRVRDLVQP